MPMRLRHEHFYLSGSSLKSIIPYRLLQGCFCNWCRTRGITSINHRVEDRLFSPAALLWCVVTMNIKAQFPAIPVLLIVKSHNAGARYAWRSLQTIPEWGGLRFLLLAPKNTSHCEMLWDSVTPSLCWDSKTQVSQLYQLYTKERHPEGEDDITCHSVFLSFTSFPSFCLPLFAHIW